MISRRNPGIILILMSLGCFQLSSCDWSHESPSSVLLIAIDALPSSAVPCNEEEITAGEGSFHVICREMVHFSRAYSPSVMTQATLASLLTGVYPFEHGLRDNSARSFLSATWETTAELALKKGVRTGFFSGGPPTWRGAGLAQGFERFEDQIGLALNQIYRPIGASSKIFLNWLDAEVRERPFFAVIFAPDLRFPLPNSKTNSLSAVDRVFEKGRGGQLREIESSLVSIISELKSRKRWDRTLVVVTGLNGSPRNIHGGEIDGTNLYDENTQVALFIKPILKPHDQFTGWKVDANVSLVDVGKTLSETLNPNKEKNTNIEQKVLFPVRSLVNALANVPNDLESARAILVESAWPKWKQFAPIRYGLHSGFFSVIAGNRLKVFNTLIDPDQLLPLSSDDATYRDQVAAAKNYLKPFGSETWLGIPPKELHRLTLAKKVWSEGAANPELNTELFEQLALGPVGVGPIQYETAWAVKYLIKNSNWKQLLRLGKLKTLSDVVYLAQRNLGFANVELPGNGCLALMNPAISLADLPTKRELCPSDLAYKLLVWIKSPKTGAETDRSRELFLKEYQFTRIEQDIASANYANGFVWDTQLTALNSIDMTELMLELPEFKSIKEAFQKKSKP